MAQSKHGFPSLGNFNNEQKTQEQGDKVVLLDVDLTLLYEDTQINHSLIDVLVKKEITKVYFLTKMDLKDIWAQGHDGAPCSRHSIIEEFKKKGISVEAVITPADPYFSDFKAESGKKQNAKDIGLAYKTCYETQMKKRLAADSKPLNRNDYASDEVLELLFLECQWDSASYMLQESLKLQYDQKATFSKLGLCLTDKTTGKPIVPKHFFDSLPKVLTHFISSKDAADNRSKHLVTKAPSERAVEIFANTYNTDNPKAAMLKHAMNQGLLKPHDSVYFFDDEESSLHNIAAAIHEHNDLHQTKIKIFTCLMPTTYSDAISPAQVDKYHECLSGNSSFLHVSSQPKRIADISLIFPSEIKFTDWTRVISDHCGQSYSIPLATRQSLCLTTLNVMMRGSVGYSVDSPCDFAEDYSSVYKRLSKISAALQQDVAYHGTAIFVLQDCWNSFNIGNSSQHITINMAAALKERMGAYWNVVQGKGGLFTLYHSKRLTMHPRTTEDRYFLETLFQDKQTKKLVKVVNIHKIPPNSATSIESYIKGFVNTSTQTAITVVVGDFNQSIPSPDLFPKDNRLSIRPKQVGTNPPTYECTDACFMYDPSVDKDFHQITTDELFLGHLDTAHKIQHITRIPFSYQQVNAQRTTQPYSDGFPSVLFPSQHRLFSFGPTLADVKKHFPKNSYRLLKEPSLLLYSVLVETTSNSKSSWMCHDSATKIHFMQVPFAQPTCLSRLFCSIDAKVAAEKDRTAIKEKALSLMDSHDDYRHILAQPQPDALAINRIRDEYDLAKCNFIISIAPYDKPSSIAKEFCALLKISICTAAATAILGAAIGACVGAGIGSFGLPILGSFAGAIAGLIAGVIIGAGLGLVAGPAYSIFAQKSFRNTVREFQESVKITVPETP